HPVAAPWPAVDRDRRCTPAAIAGAYKLRPDTNPGRSLPVRPQSERSELAWLADLQSGFYVRFVSYLLQPEFRRLFHAAVAHGRVGTLAQRFIGVVEVALAQQLHDVPPVLGAERLTDFPFLQMQGHAGEFRDEGVG